MSNLVEDTLSLQENRLKLIVERIINKLVFFTQFCTWPILVLIFSVLFKIDIRGKKNLKSIDNPFILVANHFSFFDSFLLRVILGLFTPHLPLRFMAVKKFEWRFLNILCYTGIIDFIYFLFGVFTVTPGRGIEYNLKRAHDVLKSGANVVIFPEGRISQHDNIGDIKKGAVVLAQHSGFPILPITFKVIKTNSFRKKIVANIGEPYYILPSFTSEIATKKLRDVMVNLHKYSNEKV
jgi:1-acyl-sn-glycerol-3-phosphate acyltransferase